MIASLKEFVLPFIVYAIILGSCASSIWRNPRHALWVYLALVVFPQLWYPVHSMPLGTKTLTLLVLAMFMGSVRFPNSDPTPAPASKLIWTTVIYTYACLWAVSLRYDLPLPVTGDNPQIEYWKNFAMMLTLYFLSYRLIDTEDHAKTLIVMLAVILLLTSWREYRNFYGAASFSYERRATGTFPMLGMGANHFAAFVANVAALCLGMYAMDQHRWRRRLYLVTFVCALYPLFFSYSRGAYAALVAAVAVVGLLRYRRLLIVLAILGAFWQVLLPDTVVERMTMTENADGELEESAALRLIVWRLAEDLFASYPVFGIGFNGFYYASDGLALRNAHNYFLQVAAEQGVIGLGLMITAMLRAMWSGWRLYKEGSSDLLRGLGLGFLAYAVCMSITNVFGDRYSQLSMGSYFWLLFGSVERGRMLSRTPARGSEGLQAP